MKWGESSFSEGKEYLRSVEWRRGSPAKRESRVNIEQGIYSNSAAHFVNSRL